jgi:hypothetical protein
MSNRKSNYNSLESIIRDIADSTTDVPIKLNITNNNNNLQSGGTYNLKSTHNNVNKLLSMLAEEATSSQVTSDIEEQIGKSLKMKGGKVSNNYNKTELKTFFKKYNINSVNGINTKYFIQMQGGADPVDTPVTSERDSELLGSPVLATTTGPDTENGNSDKTTEQSLGFSGGAGMNPGFQAFLNLKKKIAEDLKISNGPKAAKIAGAVQKEMKAKYTNLNSVEIAEKGLEHFKKNYDKYKKMV